MTAGGWLCRAHVRPSTGGGEGLEEAAWLAGLHICLKLVDEAPWWLPLGAPASLTRLRFLGPMGPGWVCQQP